MFIILYSFVNITKIIKKILWNTICKPIFLQVSSFNVQHQHTGCKIHMLCTVHN